MHVGVVKEVKSGEARVALTPSGVAALVADHHNVLVETGAGTGSGFMDEEFQAAGAVLAPQESVWRESDLLVKVKEPVKQEFAFLRADHTVFTYLHLAADRPLTEALLEAGTTAIAYETVQDATGLPLLTPMSEIAGRLAAQVAAHQLTGPAGGPGVLLGGAPGVAPSRVVVIGGGVVGTQAALIAHGLQAEVTILDTSSRRIRELNSLFAGRIRVVYSDGANLERELRDADVIIGAVLVPGKAAPKVLRRSQLASLKKTALLIDVAIDQGGAFETSRPTTYAEPTFVEEGILHYCVANMPGGVPRTATLALTSVTLPFIRRIASLGVDGAIDRDPALAFGVNTRSGRILHAGVSEAFPDLVFQGRDLPPVLEPVR